MHAMGSLPGYGCYQGSSMSHVCFRNAILLAQKEFSVKRVIQQTQTQVQRDMDVWGSQGDWIEHNENKQNRDGGQDYLLYEEEREKQISGGTDHNLNSFTGDYKSDEEMDEMHHSFYRYQYFM